MHFSQEKIGFFLTILLVGGAHSLASSPDVSPLSRSSNGSLDLEEKSLFESDQNISRNFAMDSFNELPEMKKFKKDLSGTKNTENLLKKTFDGSPVEFNQKEFDSDIFLKPNEGKKSLMKGPTTKGNYSDMIFSTKPVKEQSNFTYSPDPLENSAKKVFDRAINSSDLINHEKLTIDSNGNYVRLDSDSPLAMGKPTRSLSSKKLPNKMTPDLNYGSFESANQVFFNNKKPGFKWSINDQGNIGTAYNGNKVGKKGSNKIENYDYQDQKYPKVVENLSNTSNMINSSPKSPEILPIKSNPFPDFAQTSSNPFMQLNDAYFDEKYTKLINNSQIYPKTSELKATESKFKNHPYPSDKVTNLSKTNLLSEPILMVSSNLNSMNKPVKSLGGEEKTDQFKNISKPIFNESTTKSPLNTISSKASSAAAKPSTKKVENSSAASQIYSEDLSMPKKDRENILSSKSLLHTPISTGSEFPSESDLNRLDNNFKTQPLIKQSEKFFDGDRKKILNDPKKINDKVSLSELLNGSSLNPEEISEFKKMPILKNEMKVQQEEMFGQLLQMISQTRNNILVWIYYLEKSGNNELATEFKEKAKSYLNMNA